MRKFNELSLQITEEEYRSIPCLSQSSISRYAREGFSCIPKLFDPIESPSLLFGSIVDCLVTSPEEFAERFTVANLPKLSDNLDPIIRSIYSIQKSAFSLSEVPNEIIHSVCNSQNYYSNPKFHNLRLKKVREEGKELFKALHSVGEKTLINTELYQDALECKNKIMTSYASRFFTKDIFNEDIEVFTQLKFKNEYEGVEVKGMLDSITVNHKNKVIIPADLKTSYKPAYNFPESYLKWAYPIQSQLYTWLIQKAIEGTEYESYRIIDFFFIVISNSDKEPMVWRDYMNKSEGATLSKGEIVYKNWREYIKEIDFYLKNPDRKIPIGYYDDKPNDISLYI